MRSFISQFYQDFLFKFAAMEHCSVLEITERSLPHDWKTNDAMLQKAEDSLWYMQRLHFDDL